MGTKRGLANADPCQHRRHPLESPDHTYLAWDPIVPNSGAFPPLLTAKSASQLTAVSHNLLSSSHVPEHLVSQYTKPPNLCAIQTSNGFRKMSASSSTEQGVDGATTDSPLCNSTAALLPYPTSGTRASEDQEQGEAAKTEEEDEDMSSWSGQPAVKGSSETMRMALLTFSMIGLQ